jgi:uncharacterized membrane protein
MQGIKAKKIILILVFLLFFMLASLVSGATRKILPNLSGAQDAVDIAMANYNYERKSATFIIVKDGDVIGYRSRDNIVKGRNLALIDNCSTYVARIMVNSVELIFSC